MTRDTGKALALGCSQGVHQDLFDQKAQQSLLGPAPIAHWSPREAKNFLLRNGRCVSKEIRTRTFRGRGSHWVLLSPTLDW